MKAVTDKEIRRKIELENPWWGEQDGIDEFFSKMKHRAYLDSFYKLVKEREVRRAVVLMGPRRVGKTVMIYHSIQQLLEEGVDPKRICYISIDAPVYIGIGLEQLLLLYKEASGLDSLEGCYVFFDEIQYLKFWEVHLKKLVDDYRDVKFIASGSAAAALRMKSQESGAGRFTDFILPPLTFYEYQIISDKKPSFKVKFKKNTEVHPDFSSWTLPDIESFNKEFINYMNYGGYPEVLTSPYIQNDPGRFIRSDIIDKILLRDLPSIYGIHDVHELYRFFSMLAYNTGNEVSLDSLSHGSGGVAKNTIKKYLEYLEAAFLIKILHRIDQAGKRFKRANFFKVYLTNPSMRCALFEPIPEGHEFMGNMVETAIISQWLNSERYNKELFYARWREGEVDLVNVSEGKVKWCKEIKSTNRAYERPYEELGSFLQFIKKNKLPFGFYHVTTKDRDGVKEVNGIDVNYIPASIECFLTGEFVIEYML